MKALRTSIYRARGDLTRRPYIFAVNWAATFCRWVGITGERKKTRKLLFMLNAKAKVPEQIPKHVPVSRIS